MCKAFVDRELLEEQQIAVIHRPLFFGQFAFGVGFTPVREQWYRYDELKEFVSSGLDDFDFVLQTNKRTLDFHAFSSDPSVLRWLLRHQSPFYFNHIRLVDRSCWTMKLPAPRPKTKFYGEFGWRISFKNSNWGVDPENAEHLERLSGPLKLVVAPRTFLYLSKLSDVLMFKLMAAEQILDIEDRSSL